MLKSAYTATGMTSLSQREKEWERERGRTPGCDKKIKNPERRQKPHGKKKRPPSEWEKAWIAQPTTQTCKRSN